MREHCFAAAGFYARRKTGMLYVVGNQPQRGGF